MPCLAITIIPVLKEYRAEEDAERRYYDDCPECRNLGSDCRIEKIDCVVADPDCVGRTTASENRNMTSPRYILVIDFFLLMPQI